MGASLNTYLSAQRALNTTVEGLRESLLKERNARQSAQAAFHDFRTQAAAALGSSSIQAGDLIESLNDISNENATQQMADNFLESSLQRRKLEIELLRKQNEQLRATVHTLLMNTSKIATQLGANE